jgi:hypothetical protein
MKTKIAKRLMEFCFEASVLTAILGVLEAAIARANNGGISQTPLWEIFLFSFGLGAVFFAIGCILEMWIDQRQPHAMSSKEDTDDLRSL